MTQLVAAATEQARRGWTPDRTAVFSSWGGSALGNIGSFEWGEVGKRTHPHFEPRSGARR